MKIFFIGTVEFSRHALQKIIDIGGDVVGVYTLNCSSFNSDFCDLSPLSREHGIPVRYADDVNSEESIKWLTQLNPDVIFCLGWSKLLKKEILNIPSKGVIGFHPTALPANRGRHPLIWALALGLNKTATTFFFMDEDADSGDILSQVSIPIENSDDAGALYRKIITTALNQIEDFLPNLINGRYVRVKQDNCKANAWRKRNTKDGLVDWRMGADTIHNLVRSLSKPYPGADFQYQNSNFKLWKTEVILNEFDNIEPGRVIDVLNSEYPVIKCGKNAIKLLDVEPKLLVAKGSYL